MISLHQQASFRIVLLLLLYMKDSSMYHDTIYYVIILNVPIYCKKTDFAFILLHADFVFQLDTRNMYKHCESVDI